jgi:hypothetical protein
LIKEIDRLATVTSLLLFIPEDDGFSSFFTRCVLFEPDVASIGDASLRLAKLMALSDVSISFVF